MSSHIAQRNYANDKNFVTKSLRFGYVPKGLTDQTCREDNSAVIQLIRLVVQARRGIMVGKDLRSDMLDLRSGRPGERYPSVG